MSISRKISKSEKILWIWTILLSIVLLFGQNVKLHVHSIDHADNQQLSHHQHIDGLDEHSQLGEAHLSTDISHSDHHADIVSEIDTSLNALLTDISSKMLTLAFLFTMLVFLWPGFYPFIFHRRIINPAIPPGRYLLSPPLRAPPL